MSSNHKPTPLSGVVTQRGIPVGGLAIPQDRPQEFIEAFLQQYQSLGLGAYLLNQRKLAGNPLKFPDRQSQDIPHDPDS